MKPSDLVKHAHSEAESCLKKYIVFFNENGVSEDPNIVRMVQLYLKSDGQDQRAIREFIEIIQADALGSIFSLLDNDTFPEGQDVDLILTHRDEKLNGDLNDIHWEIIEARNT